jgi:hypothetical protein
MTFDLSDYRKAGEAQKLSRNRTEAPKIVAAARAAVSAEAVTTSPEWNEFLTYLQESRNGFERILKANLERLADPRVITPDQIAAHRNEAIMAKASIVVLDAVMTLPKDLLEGRKRAALLNADEAVGP